MFTVKSKCKESGDESKHPDTPSLLAYVATATFNTLQEPGQLRPYDP